MLFNVNIPFNRNVDSMRYYPARNQFLILGNYYVTAPSATPNSLSIIRVEMNAAFTSLAIMESTWNPTLYTIGNTGDVFSSL